MSCCRQHRVLPCQAITVALLCGAMGLPASAQVDCLTLTNRSPSAPTPPAGFSENTGAYDSIRQVTVFHTTTSVNNSATWEWDGATWNAASTAGPDIDFPLLTNYDMVFDSNRGVCVLVVFSGVWEWDGTTWTDRAPSLNPGPAAFNFDLAFDSSRNVVVVFGGQTNSDGSMLSQETWEYDGSSWAQRFPANPPPGRRNHRMIYDSRRDVIVLFGGRDGSGNLNETWEYDRSSDAWLQRNLDAGSVVPPARFLSGMAYDSVRGVTVMYSGLHSAASLLGDIWEWDGQAWALRGPTLVGVAPADLERGKPVVAYDGSRQRTVMVSGVGSRESDLVLELSAPPAPEITIQPLSQAVVQGQPAVFEVEATSTELLAYQWRLNGIEIPEATFASYAIDAISDANGGVYDVVVGLAGHEMFTCPAVVSDPVILSIIPAVPGDVDGDGDFDLDDLAILLPTMTGPQ